MKQAQPKKKKKKNLNLALYPKVDKFRLWQFPPPPKKKIPETGTFSEQAQQTDWESSTFHIGSQNLPADLNARAVSKIEKEIY